MLDPSLSQRKPPPKQARAKAKRDSILSVAERLIAHLPPGELTTRQLAEEANIPIGSVYRYFENLEHVLLALFQRINAGTAEQLRQGLGETGSDWQADLDRTFDHLITMHETYPNYGRLLAHMDQYDRQNDEITALLDALVAQNAPHLSADIARDITQTIIAMMEGVERQLHRLPVTRRTAVLEQTRIAIRHYLLVHMRDQP